MKPCIACNKKSGIKVIDVNVIQRYEWHDITVKKPMCHVCFNQGMKCIDGLEE